MFNYKKFKKSKVILVLVTSTMLSAFMSTASASLRDDDISVSVATTFYYNGTYEGNLDKVYFGNTDDAGIVGNTYVTLVGNQIVIDYISKYGPDFGPANYMFISSGTTSFTSAISLDGAFTSDDISVNATPSYELGSNTGPGIWINLLNGTSSHAVLEISTVPEPETFVLTLTGLTLIGVMVKRREKSVRNIR